MAHFANSGFPNAGISTVDFQVPYKGPTSYFDDFMQWRGSGEFSETDESAKWNAISTGTTPTITQGDDFDGGTIVMSTVGNTTNDEIGIQLGGAAFIIGAGTAASPFRPMRFVVRFQTSGITTATQYFGMYVKDAFTTSNSPAVTGTQPVGIGFSIVNGVVSYHTKLSSATTHTATGFGSVAVDTWYTFEIQMNQSGVFSFWVNGVKYTDNVTTNAPISATAALSPGFGVKATGSVTPTMTVDYLYAAVAAAAGGR